MKSKANPASLLMVLLSVAAGVAIGWWGKGMLTGRGSGSQGAVVPTVEISRTGSGSATSLTSQKPTGVNAEESKALAAQLLQTMLDDWRDKGRDELLKLDDSSNKRSEEMLKIRFQSALAGCDETAVAEMIEALTRYGNDSGDSSYYRFFIVRRLDLCSRMLVARMVALNPWKALEGLVSLAQANLPISPSDFLPVLEPLSASALVQAQAVIEKLPPSMTRTWAEHAWLQASVKYDPEAVFQHLMNLDDAAFGDMDTFDPTFEDLLRTLGVDSTEKALRITARFPLGRLSSLRNQLLSGWLQSDPTAAAQWAMEQNDAAMFNACFQYYGYRNSVLDEESLRANFLTIQPSGSADSVQLAQTLAERLAIKDIPEAIRWVATLPTEAREEANVVVATAWFQTDVPAAAQWLKSWPEGGSRDKAVSRLVNCLVNEDPEGALAWAVSMKSSDRYERMQYAMNSLTFEDPAAAARALQALSEEDRAALSILKNHKLEIK